MKIRMWPGWVSLSLIVAACSNSGSPRPPEPAPVGANSASATQPAMSCREQTAALGGWIDQLLEEGAFPVSHRASGMRIVEIGLPNEHLRRLPRAPSVVVDRDRITFNGEYLADAAQIARQPGTPIQELVNRLDAELMLRCRTGDREQVARLPVTVVMQVDERAPWGVVRAVTASVHQAGYDRVDFAVREARELKPPATRPELESLIVEYERSARGGDSSAESPVAAVFKGCPQLLARAEAIPAFDHEARVRAFREIPALLGQCACAVAPSDVQAVLWWWAGRRNSDTLVSGIPVPLAATGAGRVALSTSDDSPWSEAHRVVLAGLTRGGQAFSLRGEGDSHTSPSRAEFVCPP